ncbi:hypothetical protein BT96DRAFT_943801 [Gymnopus androsaceus JB14]|uniref:Uncharacterized protein n=1 Tax=Gymnopus androsaceus JB14 TaxID=1447944 RepID=A0A6A4H5N3_9AGAR|nr:hypothetical protein BT96DRAFT_943801 [Gymnopus androsaceus JB14]
MYKLKHSDILSGPSSNATNSLQDILNDPTLLTLPKDDEDKKNAKVRATGKTYKKGKGKKEIDEEPKRRKGKKPKKEKKGKVSSDLDSDSSYEDPKDHISTRTCLSSQATQAPCKHTCDEAPLKIGPPRGKPWQIPQPAHCTLLAACLAPPSASKKHCASWVSDASPIRGITAFSQKILMPPPGISFEGMRCTPAVSCTKEGGPGYDPTAKPQPKPKLKTTLAEAFLLQGLHPEGTSVNPLLHPIPHLSLQDYCKVRPCHCGDFQACLVREIGDDGDMDNDSQWVYLLKDVKWVLESLMREAAEPPGKNQALADYPSEYISFTKYLAKNLAILLALAIPQKLPLLDSYEHDHGLHQRLALNVQIFYNTIWKRGSDLENLDGEASPMVQLCLHLDTKSFVLDLGISSRPHRAWSTFLYLGQLRFIRISSAHGCREWITEFPPNRILNYHSDCAACLLFAVYSSGRGCRIMSFSEGLEDMNSGLK